MMHIFKTLLHWLRWIITQKMLSLFSNSHFSGAFFVEEKLSHFTHHFLSHQWMGNESHSLLGNALTLTLFSHSRTLKTWFTLFFVEHTQGMMILAFLEDSSREGLFRPIGYGMQLRAWLKQVFSLLILDYIQLSDLEDRSLNRTNDRLSLRTLENEVPLCAGCSSRRWHLRIVPNVRWNWVPVGVSPRKTEPPLDSGCSSWKLTQPSLLDATTRIGHLNCFHLVVVVLGTRGKRTRMNTHWTRVAHLINQTGCLSSRHC